MKNQQVQAKSNNLEYMSFPIKSRIIFTVRSHKVSHTSNYIGHQLALFFFMAAKHSLKIATIRKLLVL